MRALAVVAGVCAVLAVAGCSKSTQSGTPTAAPQTTLTKDQLWDPCSLPDDAIVAAGLKADTKDTQPFVTERTGWKGCSWRNEGTYTLEVLSTAHSMNDVRSNTSLQNLHEVDVPGRQAVSYTEGSWGDCGVDFSTSKGVVEVIVRPSLGVPSAGDSCTIALRAAGSLNNSIPK